MKTGQIVCYKTGQIASSLADDRVLLGIAGNCLDNVCGGWTDHANRPHPHNQRLNTARRKKWSFSTGSTPSGRRFAAGWYAWSVSKCF